MSSDIDQAEEIFRPVFEAKRQHDMKRRALMHELEGWTKGHGSAAAVLGQFADVRDALAELQAEVEKHRNVAVLARARDIHRSAESMKGIPRTLRWTSSRSVAIFPPPRDGVKSI